ncbi:bifunctional diaminohydroxyphosphoribosylaminopyrimidine deaminase/5-amino-6-(5-phosphoribosylamino)uracil reductase RibD [Tenacibaculum finnmarkense]|uniref:Riboflavin biosynthesis protein RibD n=1 Tax=Tenacibaculum finnmarkense genomovar finnmarkense TaxID=1458503 RepID=A0AAP1RG31_9FLAO|nr:bifunctional diaminohydroxyphosphoribosylaminopyrimidine deaminase/5-amino-6-(5-phosphoribosylamino)uracil reductase RibD [Tenacibaculum finnmarkense]MBE7653384.1 bifunctional diaminohydroxyphosphoribosylaminopyrimidine deaminase/5-amino-6-(5-phosphoribosylamino)uracil reductase RibD [Tenacibaculum finnmarkense genomovar finnmarkense]MBE7695684.1 bifunctional diaminohydroxyphosphoribosylaminopyrimidine deaminase/5-amino-6-(5-phosphoribosylamino)uracil reductase RibD [Tenacibaculum finnmarkense
MTENEKYIKRCLQLAKNGIGTARPNPSVGAVVVYKNTIIGEGFTSAYGANHAEVNAINSVKDKTLLKEATIYVTLEPCAHFGKTPPCADLIVKHQIAKVVIGCVDTNSLVAGKGIERLQNAGINVTVGVLEDECKKHHKRFFTVQNKKRPFIVLKWAETADGFIAPLKRDAQQPVWISNSYSQQLVHKIRSQEQAILVGTNTVIADNPSLDVRHWAGNNPVRIVLDKNLRIPSNLTVFDEKVKTLVLVDKATKVNKVKEQVEVLEKIDFSSRVAEQICSVLQKHQIQSVLIEGGAQMLQTFIDANLWDEAQVFVGGTSFKNGVEAPRLSAEKILLKKQNIASDVLKTFENTQKTR